MKISHIAVRLPKFKDQKMNLVVVYGYGQKPLKLLTNQEIKGKEDVLRIVKTYIARWRIEELFRVEKQEYQLEKVRTMTFMSMRILYRLMNYLIGHHSMSLERNSQYTQTVMAYAKPIKSQDKVKFMLYRYIRELSELLRKDTKGIRAFQRIEHRPINQQLCLRL